MNYPLKVKKQINQDGFMDRPGLCWTFLVGITKFIIFLKTALFYLTVIVSSFEKFELLDKAFVEMKNSKREIFDLRRIKEIR